MTGQTNDCKLFSVEDNDEILDLSEDTEEGPGLGCTFPDCKSSRCISSKQ